MKDNWCKHYNGTVNRRCDKGHHYKAVAVEGEGIIFDRLPCFAESGINSCSDREFPTPEEMKTFEEEISLIIRRVNVARDAIVANIKGCGTWGRYAEGSVTCPVCQSGILHYRYAGNYNGHIGAECSTKGCVSWQE